MNSFYVGDGLASISQCEYHCRQGFVGVKCLPPLDILVNSLGGPAAAIAVICTILLSPVCLAYLFFKVYRNPVVVPPKLSGVRRLAHSTDGSRSVLVFGGTGVLGKTNNDDLVDNETSVATTSPRSKGSLFQSEKSGQLSSPLLFSPKTPSGGESEAGLKRRDAEASVSMTWNELSNHALRIYACGSNRPDDDLLFPRELPADAEGLISPELYSQFAAALNSQLSWSQTSAHYVYWALSWLGCPGRILFLERERRRRISRARDFVASYDHSMMLGGRARALHNSLRMGASCDGSRLFLDILYSETAAPPSSVCVGKPALPMVIAFSGHGDLQSPFALDLSDQLVACVPNLPGVDGFIDLPWIKFVLDLNSHLRVVSRHDVEGSVTKVQALLRSYNSQGFLGGVMLTLVRLWPSAKLGRKTGEVVEYYSHNPDSWLLGLLLTRRDEKEELQKSLTPSFRRRKSLKPTLRRASLAMKSGKKQKDEPRSIRAKMLGLSDEGDEFEDSSDSSLSEDEAERAALPGFGSKSRKDDHSRHEYLPYKTSRGRRNAGNDHDGKFSGGFTSDGMPFLVRQSSGSLGDAQDNVALDSSRRNYDRTFASRHTEAIHGVDGARESFRRMSRTLKSSENASAPQVWMCSPCNVRMAISTLPFDTETRSASSLGLCMATATQTVSATSSVTRAILTFLLLSLNVVDAAATFFLCLEFFCIQVGTSHSQDGGCSRLALAVYVGLPPLASICSPLIGFVNLILSSPLLHNLHSEWNYMSMISAVAATAMCFYFRKLLDITSLILSLALILLKLLQAFFLRWQLATVHEKELQASRRSQFGRTLLP